MEHQTEWQEDRYKWTPPGYSSVTEKNAAKKFCFWISLILFKKILLWVKSGKIVVLGHLEAAHAMSVCRFYGTAVMEFDTVTRTICVPITFAGFLQRQAAAALWRIVVESGNAIGMTYMLHIRKNSQRVPSHSREICTSRHKHMQCNWIVIYSCLSGLGGRDSSPSTDTQTPLSPATFCSSSRGHQGVPMPVERYNLFACLISVCIYFYSESNYEKEKIWGFPSTLLHGQ